MGQFSVKNLMLPGSTLNENQHSCAVLICTCVELNGLISTDRAQMSLEDFEHLDTIANQLMDLREQGVRMEACSVATRLFGIDNATLLEGIKPVGNTFVSLTGYQAQGYANIPIY